MTRYSLLVVIALVALTGCSFGSDDADPAPDPAPSATASPQQVAPAPAPGGPTATAEATPSATTPASAPLPLPTEPTARLAYFHVAPVDGEPASTLAAYADFVTLTAGDESYRSQLRAAGYAGLVLQFVVAAEVNGPGPYRGASDTCDTSFEPLRNGIVREPGAFCRDIHPNEDWFLHNGAGERLVNTVGETGVWYQMNPANADWRAYALERLQRDLTGTTALGYDGFFLDNVELSMVRVRTALDNSDGTVAEYAQEDDFLLAWQDYLRELSEALRVSGELWANLVSDPNDGNSWSPYLDYLDGAMSPAFATGYDGLTVGKWLNNLRQAEAAIEGGTALVLVGVGTREDDALQSFALASALLVTNGDDVYFRYVSNESSADFNSFWLYPNYDLKLGQALGPRYSDGLNWRRDFQCGSVFVQPAQRLATIEQTACVTTSD